MKNVLWKIGICLLLGFLTQGCGDPLKILQAIDEFEMKSDTIGERVGQGLVQGLDSANVDSLVARLTNIAGTELRESIDSITLDTLTAKAKVAIDELSTLVEQRLKTLLSDTAALAAIDAKINEVVAGLEQDFQGILTDVVPNLLRPENQQVIFAFRDSLLGPEFKALVDSNLVGSVETLLASPQFDSLLNKVAKLIDNSTERVDGTAIKIKKTALAIGGTILLILLAAFGILLYYFRQKSRRNTAQEELVVKLTRAIDGIPSKEAYDHVTSKLDAEINQEGNKHQREILDEILEKYQHRYPEKKKYQAFHQRMLKQLRQIDKNGELADQLIANSEDDGLREYITQELKT